MRRLTKYFCLCFLFYACLEPIDFKSLEGTQLVVIDGVFTNSVEKDQIKIGFTIEYGSQKFVPLSDANIRIYNSREESEILTEVRAGVYEFKKEKITGKIGEEYFLEIKLQDGRLYRSEMEQMRSVPPIDSLSFDIKVEEFTNDFGVVLDSRNFFLNVHTTVNQEENQDFFRWEVEHIYLFPEFYNPPIPQKFCFVREALEPQNIYILNGGEFRKNASIQETISQKRMNHTFSFPQSYRVFQYGITENAYRYFSNLNKVSNPNGNIFDPPPAAIQGNVYRIDQKEQVLGYFSVAAVDTKVRFITIEDIQDDYMPFDLCNVNQFRPRNYDLPAECFDCLQVKNSTLEKPFYW